MAKWMPSSSRPGIWRSRGHSAPPARTIAAKSLLSDATGSVSPTLDTNIATAYVRDEFAAPGTALEFLVKDKTEPCTVVALPFYQRPR